MRGSELGQADELTNLRRSNTASSGSKSGCKNLSASSQAGNALELPSRSLNDGSQRIEDSDDSEAVITVISLISSLERKSAFHTGCLTLAIGPPSGYSYSWLDPFKNAFSTAKD